MLEARSAYGTIKPIQTYLVYSFDCGLEEGSFWYYAPNKGAPIAFAILFAASGLIHIYQCWYGLSLSSVISQ